MSKNRFWLFLPVSRLIERLFSSRTMSNKPEFLAQFSVRRGSESYIVRICRKRQVVQCHVVYPTDPPSTVDVVNGKIDAVKKRLTFDLLLNCLAILNPHHEAHVRDALMEVLLGFRVHELDTALSYHTRLEAKVS